MRFADEVSIQVVAGNGGHGCLSFLRERSRPKGGPDGGDGGRGGNVYLCVDDRLMSLSDLHNSSIFRAGHGVAGAGKERKGKDGKDIEIAVPCGTLAYSDETDELIADLTTVGERAMVAHGGEGGLGNTHFRSSTNRAPRKTTQGTPGERRWLRLELRVLADVGLAGKPNAGKSTLLRALSDATPKTAPYPFTTLSPQLGVASLGDGEHSAVVADIPGLIAGAAEGRGLGHQFLRHLLRTRLLLHLVDVASADPVADHAQINDELAAYSSDLQSKPQWLVLNKTDLLTGTEAEIDARMRELVRQMGWRGPWFAASSLLGAGLPPLLAAIEEYLRQQRQRASEMDVAEGAGE